MSGQQWNRGGNYGGGPRGGQGGPPPPQVNHSLMTDYYDKDGHLKREVFIDWAKAVAGAFDRDKDTTRTNLRRTYDHVAALRFRLRMGEDAVGVLKPGLGELHRFVEYQAGRQIIGRSAKEFVQTHCKAVGSDPKKFEGFYELFQSVMAHLGR